MQWSVYIIECADCSFYTGISSELNLRLKFHNEGKASRYTKLRGPVKLRYYEILASRAEALKRELQIKKFSRSDKEKLISYGTGIRINN